MIFFQENDLQEHQLEKKIRLDKWLKIARIFKTRSQACAACEQNRVIVNNHPAKASKTIKSGDTISVKFRWKKRTFDVLDISNKSLSAINARLLYREQELTPEEKKLEEQKELFHKSSKQLRSKYKGRPTKKERRRLRRIRGY